MDKNKQMKTCTDCKQEKPLNEFYKNKKASHARRPITRATMPLGRPQRQGLR